jgi:metallophosphoesterase superfamily enzyme
MKKIYLFLLLLLPLFVCAQEKIMLIADPHVLASSLVEEGAAFDSMMQKQRKMIDMSEAAFCALVDTALQYKPALVLIPGDLTKD